MPELRRSEMGMIELLVYGLEAESGDLLGGLGIIIGLMGNQMVKQAQ